MSRPAWRRTLVVGILSLALTLVSADAQTAGANPPAAEPYQDAEFPDWALDLRRAEIVAFGVFPVAFMVSSLGYDWAYYVGAGFPAENLPWPAGAGTSGWTATSHGDRLQAKNLSLLASATVLSLAVAALDWWWGQ